MRYGGKGARRSAEPLALLRQSCGECSILEALLLLLLLLGLLPRFLVLHQVGVVHVLDTSILGGIDLMRRLKALLGAKRCVELLLLHLDKLPTQKLPCVSGVSGKALPNRSKRKENRGGGEGSERYMPLHFRPAAAAQPQHTAAEAAAATPRARRLANRAEQSIAGAARRSAEHRESVDATA